MAAIVELPYGPDATSSEEAYAKSSELFRKWNRGVWLECSRESRDQWETFFHHNVVDPLAPGQFRECRANTVAAVRTTLRAKQRALDHHDFFQPWPRSRLVRFTNGIRNAARAIFMRRYRAERVEGLSGHDTITGLMREFASWQDAAPREEWFLTTFVAEFYVDYVTHLVRLRWTKLEWYTPRGYADGVSPYWRPPCPPHSGHHAHDLYDHADKDDENARQRHFECWQREVDDLCVFFSQTKLFERLTVNLRQLLWERVAAWKAAGFHMHLCPDTALNPENPNAQVQGGSSQKFMLGLTCEYNPRGHPMTPEEKQWRATVKVKHPHPAVDGCRCPRFQDLFAHPGIHHGNRRQTVEGVWSPFREEKPFSPSWWSAYSEDAAREGVCVNGCDDPLDCGTWPA